jgi:hypothetical protein
MDRRVRRPAQHGYFGVEFAVANHCICVKPRPKCLADVSARVNRDFRRNNASEETAQCTFVPTP